MRKLFVYQIIINSILFIARALITKIRPTFISRTSRKQKIVGLTRQVLIFDTKLYSSKNSDNGENEMDKWEKMYLSGERQKQEFLSSDNNDIMIESNSNFDKINLPQSNEVRTIVITFDLDNTLWKTHDTINHANNELSTYLQENHDIILDPSRRTEHIMRELFKSNPLQYASEETPNKPVYLTQLRIDALKKIFEEFDKQDYSLDAFEIWTAARHDAILSNLASNVHSTLSELSKKYILGAITDGNSDPRRVFPDIFEFVVNAEIVGVSKPNPKIYHYAIDLVRQKFNIPTDIGTWWVHVGDDFLKDIVACKQIGMRSVWCTELLQHDNTNIAKDVKNVIDFNSDREGEVAKERAPISIEKRVQDLIKDISEKKVIEMSIGADNFLADSIEKEFVDAKIASFSKLLQVIQDWNSIEEVLDEEFATFVEKKISNIHQEVEFKYCINCGAKLPQIAKFCSSCGSKQM